MTNLGHIVLSVLRQIPPVLWESARYVGRACTDLVSGVRVLLLRRAQRHNPKRAAECSLRIQDLQQQRATRWQQWRTLSSGRRWAVRSASLLMVAGTAWASLHFLPAVGKTSGPRASIVSPQGVLILRTGITQTGQLHSCLAHGCTLDRTSFPWDAIAWIGLGRAQPPPPKVKDPTQDEIHLNDGSVRAGRLSFIGKATVVTERGNHEREAVAWIYLVPRLGAARAGAGEPGAQPEPSSTGAGDPTRPAPPSGAPTSGDRALRRREQAMQACPADKPLGGWVRARYTVDENQCEWEGYLHLRFPLVLMRGASKTGLPFYFAPSTFYETGTRGCVDKPEGLTCTGPPLHLSGKLDFSSDGGSPGISFDALWPRLWGAPWGSDHPFAQHVTCRYPDRSAPASDGPGYGGATFIDIGGVPREDCTDGNVFEICPPETGCYPLAAGPAECFSHPERYAVIPFAGSVVRYTRRYHTTWAQTDWEVCCGCGEPLQPPDFDPRTEESCTDAAQQLAQLVGKLRALRDAYETHEPDSRRAEEELAKWRDKIWGYNGSLASFSANLLQVALTAGKTTPKGVPLDSRAAALLNYRRAMGELVGGVTALTQTDDLQRVNAAIDVLSADATWRIGGNVAYAAALKRLRLYRRAHPEDLDGALRMFRQDMKNITQTIPGVKVMMQGMAVANAFLQFSDSAKRLAQDLSSYLLARQSAESVLAEMEKIQEQMQDVQAKIDFLRQRCPKETHTSRGISGAPGKALAAAFPPAQSRLLSLGAPTRLATLADEVSRPAPAPPGVAKLEALHTLYARSEERVRERILPALLPLIFADAEDVDRRILIALLRDALPDLEGLQKDLEDAADLGREIEDAVSKPLDKFPRNSPREGWSGGRSRDPEQRTGRPMLARYAPKTTAAVIKAVSLSSTDGTRFDPAKVGVNFSPEPKALVVWYRWEGASNGHGVDIRWSKDGSVVLEQGEIIEASSGSAAWFVTRSGSDPLPPGNYRVELLEKGEVVTEIPFRVGGPP